MDSLGDDNGCNNDPIKPDLPFVTSDEPFDTSDGETQLFDSQSWSPEYIGGGMEEVGHGDDLLQSTMLLDDTEMVEDAFETQMVDLAGETQVTDFGGETQEADICGETQVLDDDNCFEHMETQLLDDYGNEDVSDSDGEGSDATEVLGDKDDLTDDFLVGEGECHSADKEKDQFFLLCNDDLKLIKQPNGASHQQNNGGFHVPIATPVPQSFVTAKSGSGTMRFTSVRAASLRASGLAARNMALKETKSASSSIPTNNLASEKTDVSVTDNAVSAMEPGKEGDQERDLGRYNGIVNRSEDENMARGGNLTARKLFTEDLDIETEDLPRDTNGGEELVKLRTSDLAGLSYVDSQEPGELSQANALDFVDRFIKENVAEFDKEIVRGSTAGNSKCVSSIKGPQKLAKKANEQSMIGELGIYDWDDSHEDEGGGDIFHRRKEDFFGGGSLGRRPLKTGVNGLQELKDGKKQVNGNDKRMDIFNSDTKLLLRNCEVDKKVNEPERKFRRNLINELDKQLEKNPTKADVPEMLDVGFDTQMAAEAMEALFYGEDAANCDVNDACHGIKKNSSSHKGPKQPSSRKRSCLNVVGNASVQSMKTRRVGAISNNVSSVSSEKQSKDVRKQKEVVLVTMKSENFRKWSQENIKKRKAGSLERGINYVDDCTATLSGGSSLNKQHTQEKVGSLEPIAHRTRRSVRNTNIGIRASARLSSRDAQLNKTKNTKPKLDERFEKMEAFTDRSKNDALSCPRRKRSCRNLSCQVNKSDNINDRSEPSATPEAGPPSSEDKRSCGKTGLSIDGQHVLSSVDLDLDGKLPQKRLERVGFENAQSVQTSARLDETPREKLRPFDSSCTTPFNCKVPVSEISPVCMGDEYFNQSRRRCLSKFLVREIKFSISGPQSTSPSKDLRKRREITDVRVLYSNHLDEDVIKRQKKILARLGVSLASSIIEATHFIADQFVRTRNMLEAIASGKPVVTHLWIESCGQANCFIDEKNYILRDAKKEKEFGFSMPTSLSCASQNPLLQGFKVFVTQNTKPGKEIISSLVKAVRGRAVERIGRSALKDGSLANDLLILSCEEDYEICVPFLEKGATIYSSELILNGIVTQKLEYGRYRLFTDNLRIIRSTMRLKKRWQQVPLVD